MPLNDSTLPAASDLPLQLGLVGLVQVIPVVLLALPAGQVIDRLDRRHVIIAVLVAMMACSLALAGIARQQADYRWIYACLFVNGVARAFLQPAKSALLPLIVPRSRFANAVTWGTSGFQLATVMGPALGGRLIAWTAGALWVYVLDAVLSLAFAAAVFSLWPRSSLESSGLGIAFGKGRRRHERDTTASSGNVRAAVWIAMAFGRDEGIANQGSASGNDRPRKVSLRIRSNGHQLAAYGTAGFGLGRWKCA